MDNSLDYREISISTAMQAEEISEMRIRAHEKHGENSIESVTSNDRMMTILIEEVGEVSLAINDAIVKNWTVGRTNSEIRAELIDVMTVCSAWVDKLATM